MAAGSQHSAILLFLGIHGLKDGQTLLMIAFPRGQILNDVIINDVISEL